MHEMILPKVSERRYEIMKDEDRRKQWKGAGASLLIGILGIVILQAFCIFITSVTWSCRLQMEMWWLNMHGAPNLTSKQRTKTNFFPISSSLHIFLTSSSPFV